MSDVASRSDPATMTSAQIEDAALAFVLEHEAAAGRTAVDTRHEKTAPADVRSSDPMTGETRLIEIKGAGRSIRGKDLWLEPAQVRAGREDSTLHLCIVENILSGDPAQFRLIDLHGQALHDLLSTAREKHYFEVPMHTGVYDELVKGSEPSG